MSALETVGKIYAAFGRGDVGGILEQLSENVEWEYGATANDVPWLQARRGRAGAGAFFASLAGMEIHHFAVKALLGEGVLVIGLVDIEFTVRATGRRLREEDEIHIWQFDQAGHVSRFRHRVDTLAQQRAVAP